jgi:YfiH family protein
MNPSETAPHTPFPENGNWTTSALLDAVPEMVHGFSLRSAGDFSSGAAALALLKEIGARRLRLLRQVHGAVVAPSDELTDLPEADGWAGAPEPGELLGILTADCLPVLLCHPRSRVLGLAHVGWRGAAVGIVEQTLKAMGVPAEEMKVALGPSIGPCCYGVREDVAQALGRGSPHLKACGGEVGTYRLDLAGLVRSQLEAAGVSFDQIDVARLCTACRPDLFFSHRGGNASRRMVAFLGWS